MDAKIRTYEELSVGTEESFTISITPELVDDFARVSGDYNPLHVDESYANGTAFGERIAHGMIAGAVFSRLIGMQLPGRDALYLSQSLSFKKPIHLGTECVVRGTVVHLTPALRAITLKLTLEDTTGEVLVAGEALVQVHE